MSIKVAAFPFDVIPGEVDANCAKVLDAIAQCQQQQVKLLVLPEKWTTSFMVDYSDEIRLNSDAALRKVHEAAVAADLIVVGSAAELGTTKPENVAHVLGAAGSMRPYSKRMLFSPTGEGRQVERGTALPQAVPTGIGNLLPVVCYDLRFPEICREALYQQADIFICCAQWPTPRAHLFELLSRARAAESQVFAISCNRSGTATLDGQRPLVFPGNAFVVDPLGEIISSCTDGGLLVSEIDLDFAARVRTEVPISRDLRKAGLWPEQE
ncbi:MAG: nitrilase-related carbon-nitrogen hydrolase [Planctomycetota bacterium]|nr:nitrilase-related carbon-nitrogen hydrolase [Planctomycetota bacterium]